MPGQRKKCAIVGFCESSRGMAPYNNPEFEVWGLNRGYLFMPTADRWFDLHGLSIISSQQRRPGQHVEWLKAFPGPVYVHERFEALGPNQVEYPLAPIAADLGTLVWRSGTVSRIGCEECAPRPHSSSQHSCQCACHRPSGPLPEYRDWDTTKEPYLSSSIAYEIALAIHERFEEIHLYGVDLNTESEYAWQKPGVEYLLGVAAGRGIKVLLPDNCPLLRGTLYGRGFMSPHGESFSYDQVKTRLAALQHDGQIIQQQLAETIGARRELAYLLDQAIPGIDPLRTEGEIANLNGQVNGLHEQSSKAEGGLIETERWFRARVAELEKERVEKQLHLAGVTGAGKALHNIQQRIGMGLTHERTEDRRKAIENQVQTLQARVWELAGAVQEAAYWLHQTMAGQDPREAIKQLEWGADGPITELDVIQSVDPAIAGTGLVASNGVGNVQELVGAMGGA